MSEIIHAALNVRLDTLGLQTAWENKSFLPPEATLWIRETYLPAERRAAAMGTTSQNRHRGIYQVDVFRPAGEGSGEAEETATLIENLFKRGTVISYSGITVKIESASRTTGRKSEPWYMIPVFIRWRADIDN